MKKLLQKRLNNEKGLTLVELLAVIVILGIIAAIAVPSIGNVIENSKYNAVKADAINVLSAANLYFVENPEKGEVTVKDLGESGYLENPGSIQAAGNVTKGTPNTLSATAKYGNGDISINASIDQINNDTQKGSNKPTSIPEKVDNK